MCDERGEHYFAGGCVVTAGWSPSRKVIPEPVGLFCRDCGAVWRVVQ